MDGMTVIATTTNLAEAQVIAGVLRASGIECTVDADDAGRTNPEFDLTRGVRVLVSADDAVPARAVLDEAQQAGREMSSEGET